MTLPDLLPSSAVHLHISEDPAITSPSLLAAYEALLTPDELVRRDRFRFERHRHQFLVSRALLRTTLTHYHPSVLPQDWRFALNTHGRPRIEGEIGNKLDFNLSHTEGCIVLAVSRVASPGVDIEAVDRTDATIELACEFFSPAEVAELLVLAEPLQRRRFFDLWTMKEAYVKAKGLGLAIPLTAFTIGFPTANCLSIDFQPEANDVSTFWQLWSVDMGDHYALSLAINCHKALSLRLFSNLPLQSIAETDCVIMRSTARYTRL